MARTEIWICLWPLLHGGILGRSLKLPESQATYLQNGADASSLILTALWMRVLRALCEPFGMKAITGLPSKHGTMRASSWFMRYSYGKSTLRLTGWICVALGESLIFLFLQR